MYIFGDLEVSWESEPMGEGSGWMLWEGQQEGSLVVFIQDTLKNWIFARIHDTEH